MSNGRPWTEADTATLRRMAGKYTDREIALRTGHKPVTVFYRRKALGLPCCRRKDWQDRMAA